MTYEARREFLAPVTNVLGRGFVHRSGHAAEGATQLVGLHRETVDGLRRRRGLIHGRGFRKREVVVKNRNCWRTTGDPEALLYDSSAIEYGRFFVQTMTQVEPRGCASDPQGISA